MAKQTVLDKAIADIEKDIAVLQAAKQRLVTQQATAKKPIRKPRVVIRHDVLGDGRPA